MTISQFKAIHFGAGNIGRGFIGPLLVESGYHVIFADVDKDIIQLLNARDLYDVLVLDDDEEYHNSVSNVSGIDYTSDDVIQAQAFADPTVDLVTTAVGPTILERIATIIVKGLHARREANGPPLNIVACENVINQTTLLPIGRGQALGLREHRVCRLFRRSHRPPVRVLRTRQPPRRRRRGLLRVGRGRSCSAPHARPAQGREAHEEYAGLRRAEALHAQLRPPHHRVPGLPQGPQHHRRRSARQEIHDIVRAALRDEAGAALIRRHEFDEEEYGQHVDKIMERFPNPRLKDDVVRVGREPLRKLSKGDWLLGPNSMALELGLPTDNMSMGIAAAFRYDVPEDKQRVELQNRVKREGISKVVADLTGFEEGGEEHRKIMDAYKELRFEYMPPN